MAKPKLVIESNEEVNMKPEAVDPKPEAVEPAPSGPNKPNDPNKPVEADEPNEPIKKPKDPNTSDQNLSGQKAPDPFDAEALRLPPSFVETAGVKKILSTVPVRKPTDQEWFRVHPGETYRGNFACIKLKEENEFYILTPALAAQIPEETISVILYTCVNKNGVVFLWPVKVPIEGAQGQQWHVSAHEMAELAMRQWIRIKANRGIGAYEHSISDNPVTTSAEPKFPQLPFGELLKLGFQKTGRFVTNFEHPVIKMLRG